MASINLALLGGNMSRDPETRYTTKGVAIVEFGLAVNRKWKDAEGDLQEEVSFFDCTAFGKTAEVVAEYCKKGSSVLVEGRLKQDTWEDKADGRKRSKVKVIVERIHFTGGKPKAEGDGARPTAPRRASSQSQPDAKESQNQPDAEE